ncbi:MAG: hypothetical protein COA42_13985 [Alteromonadaceae bacterium]|nr:MAG: hypothetical protein COA42_13985 [Alteromonadaceae bacterium]
MPLFILSLLFQVGFVIHIIKTGRSTTWIWIVITGRKSCHRFLVCFWIIGKYNLCHCLWRQFI